MLILEAEFQNFLNRIDDPEKPHEFLGNVEGAVNELGFKYYSIVFGDFIGKSHIADELFFFNNYPDEFNEQYISGGFADADTGILHALKSIHSELWGVLDQDASKAHPSSLEYQLFELAAEYGLRMGVTIPGRFQRTRLPFALSLVGTLPEAKPTFQNLFEQQIPYIRQLMRAVHLACPTGYLARQYLGLEMIDLRILKVKAEGGKNSNILSIMQKERIKKQKPKPITPRMIRNRNTKLYAKLYRNEARIGPKILWPKAHELERTLRLLELWEFNQN